MGADEARTVRSPRAPGPFVLPMVGRFSGRIIDTAGDGILAEFASVVSAVECAIALQKIMAERNSAVAQGRRMQFRIGVNLGDVIYDKRAHLWRRRQCCRPPGRDRRAGRHLLSEDAYRQVRGKLDIPIVDAGEQNLKNIANPIQVYRSRLRRRRPPRAVAARRAAAAMVGAGRGGGGDNGRPRGGCGHVVRLLRGRPEVSRSTEPPQIDRLATMPIIAVLPFANQTGDAGQDYFADGVTEEVINALGRFNTLRVIGRNAVMRYRARPHKTKSPRARRKLSGRRA